MSGKDNNNDYDRGARAYASIQAQLSLWGDDDNNTNTLSDDYHGNVNEYQQDYNYGLKDKGETMMDIHDTTPEYNHNDDQDDVDELEEGYDVYNVQNKNLLNRNNEYKATHNTTNTNTNTSKTISTPSPYRFMFTPPTKTQTNTTTKTNNNNNNKTPVTSSFIPSTNPRMPVNTPLPPGIMATPAAYHIRKEANQQLPSHKHYSSSTSTTNTNTHYNNNNLNLKMEDVTTLDADYRPYYTTTRTLIHSLRNQNHIHHQPQEQQQVAIQNALLQYIHLLSSSNYTRSALLQETNTNNLDIKIQRLEQEGNVWNLLYSLLHSGYKSFVLYTPSSSSSNNNNTTKNMNTNQKYTPEWINVQQWMKYIIHQHGEHLDPAGLLLLIHDLLHTNNTTNHDNDDEIVSECLTPHCIQRRLIILNWIQSCHSRSISSSTKSLLSSLYHPETMDSNSATTTTKVTWWKDTIRQYHHSNSFHHSMTNTNFIHPDVLYTTTTNKKKENETFSLHPQDLENETQLLSTCLSLLKAGQLEDMFRLCRYYKRYYRVVAWDGNKPFGILSSSSSSDTLMNASSNNNDDSNAAEMKQDDFSMDMDMDMNRVNREDTNVVAVQIGNPSRMVWKRTMWKVGRALHNRLNENTSTNTTDNRMSSNKNTFSTEKNHHPHSSLLIYEAAITSLLADDTEMAISNPKLSHNFMDLIWIYYRSMHSRLMEEFYHVHNSFLRGKMASQNGGSSGIGNTEGGRDAVTNTSVDTSLIMNKGLFMILSKGTDLEREQLACTEDMGCIDERTLLHHIEELFSQRGSKSGVTVTGRNFWMRIIVSFLSGNNQVMEFLRLSVDQITQTFDECQNSLEGEDESLLRFLVHLLLFLDVFTDADDKFNDIRDDIVAQRDSLLLCYVQNMFSHRSLWPYVGLYSSLLPKDTLFETTFVFWATQVEDDMDRRMVLKHAREHFDNGLDLAILSQLVPSIIDGSSCSDYELPSSWLTLPKSRDDSLWENYELEARMDLMDIRKIHSIDWLCYYPEHYPDALKCCSKLVRKLLLEINEKPGSDSDWSDNVKLYTAKLFTFRCIPHQLNESISRYLENDDYEVAFDPNDIAEYQDMVLFLDVHCAYESWRRTLTHMSPRVFMQGLSKKTVTGTLENEIAMKLERKKFVDEKKSCGSQLVEASEVIYTSLLNILNRNPGWLNIPSSDIGSTRGETLSELKLVRSKCLVKVVILILEVLDKSAKWIEEFVDDVVDTFGKNQSDDILSSIHVGMGLTTRVSEDENSPLKPSFWYGIILEVSKMIDTPSNNIISYFDDHELRIVNAYTVEAQHRLNIA